MKRVPLLSVIIAAIVAGAWAGWRSGIESMTGRWAARTVARTPGDASTTAGSLIRFSVPGTITSVEWRELSGGFTSGDFVHAARLAEAARDLSTGDLRALLEEARADSRKKFVGLLIGEAVRRDPAAACDFLLSEEKEQYETDVFPEWGRQNPHAALAWLDAHPEQEGCRYEIIRGWSERDPSAAFRKLAELSDKGGLASMDSAGERWTFFSSWAQKDPEAAVAAWASRPDLDFCQHAQWRPALAGCDPLTREGLISAIMKVSNADLRPRALAGCADYLAGEGQPRRAAALSEDPSLSQPERQHVRRLVLEAWVRDEAAPAADWYLNSSPSDEKNEAIGMIVKTWNTFSDADTPDSLGWLLSLPSAILPDSISQSYIESRYPFAPADVLRGWLALQPDGEGGISDESVARLGHFLSTAPQAARLPAFLHEAGFSAELSAQILTAAGQGGGTEVSGD